MVPAVVEIAFLSGSIIYLSLFQPSNMLSTLYYSSTFLCLSWYAQCPTVQRIPHCRIRGICLENYLHVPSNIIVLRMKTYQLSRNQRFHFHSIKMLARYIRIVSSSVVFYRHQPNGSLQPILRNKSTV